MGIGDRLIAAYRAFTRGDRQVRYVVASRRENEAQRRKREAIHAQLRRENTERDLVAAVAEATRAPPKPAEQTSLPLIQSGEAA